MMARSRDYGSRRRYGYLCGYHHQRGRTVCVNGLEAPMDTTDHAVLASVEHDLLRPEPGCPQTLRVRPARAECVRQNWTARPFTPGARDPSSPG
jgi:hypothetical protein